MDLEELQRRRKRIVAQLEEDRQKWHDSPNQLSASINHLMVQVSLFQLSLVDTMIETKSWPITSGS